MKEVNLNTTLIIIKPQAYANGHTKAILKDIQQSKNGIQVVAFQQGILERGNVEKLYAEHANKSFYPNIVDSMCQRYVVCLVILGNDVLRHMIEIAGATSPSEAHTGSIRQKYGTSLTDNAMHRSFDYKSACREISILFGISTPVNNENAQYGLDLELFTRCFQDF